MKKSYYFSLLSFENKVKFFIMGVSRPFRILGMQQVALGALDQNKLHKLWIDLLGVKKENTFYSEKENVDETILKVGKEPFHVEVDLMQPIDPSKKPKVHEPPLNHIGLWVDNLKLAYDWLSQQGVRFTQGGIRKGASGHDVCFIHPKGNEEFSVSGNGVLIELVEAPKELLDAQKYQENQ